MLRLAQVELEQTVGSTWSGWMEVLPRRKLSYLNRLPNLSLVLDLLRTKLANANHFREDRIGASTDKASCFLAFRLRYE